MRALFFVAFVLCGCQLGPGATCKVDTDCANGLRCSTLGYCFVGGSGGGSGGGAGGGAAGDAGTPKAVVSSAPIDFGDVGCGKPATVKQLDLVNQGDGPYAYTATLAGSTAFTLNSTATGGVDGGSITRLSIGAAVPANANAGTVQTGTLTVTTSDPTLPKVDVPLKLTAAGVTLTLNPSIASFGTVPVMTQAPRIPLVLTNTGNVPATLTLAAPTDPQFSLGWDAGAPPLVVAPGASVPELSAGFRPTVNSPLNASSTIGVLEAVCGASVPAIPMTGQGTSGSIGISTGDVFFGTNGKVACGTTAPSRTFTLANTGNSAFSWTAVLGKGASSPFTFMPNGGTVLMNSSVVVTVTASAIPAQASTAPDAYGDTLTLTTDVAGDSPHPVVLHQTASGAILFFAPSAVDFGLVPINGTATAPFSVLNDGNAPATVTLSSNSASFSASPAALVASGGTTSPVTGTFAPGASTAQQTAILTMATDAGDVLCAPLPAPLTMTGQGTNGTVSFSPVALDFGSVNCGSTASPRTVTFRNDGNQSYAVSAVLAAGAASPYSVALTPDSGIVFRDGGTLLVTVTPKPVPATSAVSPNLYGDTLTVTTNVSGDTPHAIPLRETAQGAIFALSSPSIGFGGIPVGVSAQAQFTVSNTGNLAGTLQFQTASSIFGLPATVTVPGAGSAVRDATFTPAAVMPYSDSATLTKGATTVLCQPLPPSLMLSGTGTAAAVVGVVPTSLTFGSGGLVPCGTTAAAKTVTVTNNSSQTLTMTYLLAGGATSPYTVTGPATLAMGAMGTVTVTPKPVPAVQSTAPDALAGTLTLRGVGGVVDESHQVALHQTAQGAVLAFNPGSLVFPPSPKTFNVINSGNLAAPFTLTLGGGQPGDWAVNPSSSTAAGGGNVLETVTYARSLLPLGTHTANITIATGVVLCGPLPGAISLTD